MKIVTSQSSHSVICFEGIRSSKNMASENEGNKNLEAIKQKISPVIHSLSTSISNVSETREKAKASKADEVEKKEELTPFNKLMQAYNNSHLEFHRMVTDMSKIAKERERASVISLSRRAVRFTINQTQQKEHDLSLSKVKKSKEDIIKKQRLISEISKMNFKTKKYIDSNIKEMSNLLSQMPEPKLINSDHQTEIKMLNNKLSNYNATNDKFKSEYEEMQSNNEKIRQMCKKKQDEITKLSLELKELNKSKENIIKEEEEIKKEIEILEKIVVKARQNSKGIKNPLIKEKEENSGDSF